MGGDALVALGVGDDGAFGVDIAEQLGLDPFEARLERGVDRLVPRGVGLVDLLERLDAVGVERVGPGVIILVDDAEAIFLVLQFLEELERALAADPGGGEIMGAGEIGARFLGAAERKEIGLRGLLARRHDAHPGLARARRHGRGAKQEREQADLGRHRLAVTNADRVAARDMAEFVGDDALELVHIVRSGEQARLDIDRLAGGDEGVDLGVVEEDDVDAFGVELGGLDQRFGNVAEQRLGLAVTQHGLRESRLGGGERKGQADERGAGGAPVRIGHATVSHRGDE